MATLNGNDVYLALDGVDISGWWTEEVSLEKTMNTQDVTSGAGATHIEYAPGLIDGSGSFMVVYDVQDVQTYLPYITLGLHHYDYGPEGRVSGKPRESGQIIISDVSGPNVTIEKEKVSFEISYQQSGKPTREILNGDTW